MANAVYGLAKASFLTGQINLTGANIKCSLVTASYTPNAATDQFQSSITAGLVAGTTDQTITSPTVTGGAYNHAPVTWNAVPNGSAVRYLVYYDSTSGSSSTNRLICVLDTETGLPLTGNGGNVTWTPAAGGVFAW